MKRKKRDSFIFDNLLYSFKQLFLISKSRVIHSVIRHGLGFLFSIFYSSFFIRFLVNSLESKKPVKYLLLSIIILGIVTVLISAYIYYCDNVLFPICDIKIYQELYKKIFQKSENIELDCYENQEFYNNYTIALDDAGNKMTGIVVHTSRFILGTIAGLISFAIMIEIDKLSLLFVIAPLFGNIYITPKISKISYKRYVDGISYQRRANYVNRVMYLPEYAKELRLSNVFQILKRDYIAAMEGLSSLYKKYSKKEFSGGVIQYILSYIVIFEGILLYGSYRAIVSKSISFGQMAVLSTTMVFASWVWLSVRDSISFCNQNSLFISKLRTFMEYQECIPENTDGILPDKNIRSIEFRNVSFSYGNGKSIIKNLSFIIKGNMSIALVGHNGAGKTTIIKLLLRFYDPTEGKILVNGIDIKEYNLRAYRELFTTAFQDVKIFANTVRYNLLMGEKIENEDENIRKALTDAGLFSRIQQLPNGVDTILTKEFSSEGAILSGGELQKLIVARAFIKNEASIAIFDEPSSALDPISENEIFERIMQFTKNKIGIYISHRLSSVKNADSVLMLDNGEIIEQGTHEELMNMKGEYSKIYKLQQQNYKHKDS